jgi:hypothetical protein
MIGGDYAVKPFSRLSLTAALVLPVLMLPAISLGQSAANSGPPGVAEINPPAQHCNETPDTVPALGGPPEVPERIATEVIPQLLTSGLPCAETVNTSGLPGSSQFTSLQRGFDFYSWLTFIALNAPSDGSPIASGKPTSRTVWEDPRNYMQLADIMLPDRSAPTWGKRVVPAECEHDFEPGMTLIRVTEETYNQPFKTGPLIDQNGNYALFDILLNKPMFDYILTNKLYSKAGQAAFGEPVIFPVGVNPKGAAPGRVGAIMLKVSWRVLDPIKDEASMERFHTVDALVYIPRRDAQHPAVCPKKTLGLVGFHAVHKTSDRQQWIWTTFEHAENAPELGAVTSGHLLPHYSFFNAACPKCQPFNQTPPRPWTIRDGLEFGQPFRSQIVRTDPIANSALELNPKFQGILAGTVWKNYMLVSTQWPSDFACAGDPNSMSRPDPTCGPAPTYLANTTLETYSQKGEDNKKGDKGGIPIATSSCMACHGNAATTQRQPAVASDFTFTLEKAH